MDGFWSGFWGPFFTFTGSVIVAVIANFIAKDFERFRDGSALASAIAGELGSYAIAIEELTRNVTWLAEQAEAGKAIRVADIELPRDSIYESAVPKLGLLGVELPEKVALTYGRIRAFRTLYMVIAGDKVKTDVAGLGRLYRQLLVKLTEAETEGRQTVTLLHARANETFCHSLRGSWKRWRETRCRT
ncbi:hypothetical protein LMG28688_05949 [Paraburkholderia caffeinitolerans]|uniref:Uncharacterized protein n=1 Tax=Paraburkholderia caffeinitolerans TaxID=1723730 RepID=A0A6J5GRW4_9BURK|nr:MULTISPECIES: hypothetical protein [Paraburkholderia]CAB3804310.1 hypothetical protein LMG28688_05949 [Paraburkholderia caffeinitolerans]